MPLNISTLSLFSTFTVREVMIILFFHKHTESAQFNGVVGNYQALQLQLQPCRSIKSWRLRLL